MMSEQTNQLIESIPNSPVKYSPAAEAVGSNVDLLTEILLRVPAKPLIKFKCVSKHWLSLISDSEFGSNHTRRNPTPPVSGMYVANSGSSWLINNQYSPLTLGGRRVTNSVPPLSFLHEAMSGAGGARIACSSNGLILCCSGYRNYSYFVCNPTMKKFAKLPKSSVTPSRLEFLKEEPFLCFDPTKSPYYKVLVLTTDYGDGVSQLAIYTSECASWKIVSLEARIPNHYYLDGAIWNGGIIWIEPRSVSRLDLNTQKLTSRLARGQNGSEDLPQYFGECGGHLLLIQPSNSHDALEVKELEMDRDDFCWIVRYQVDLRTILPNRSRCVPSLISVVKGAKENDLALVYHNQGKVFSYNLERRRVKALCKLCPEIARQTLLYKESYQFIESLSPV